MKKNTIVTGIIDQLIQISRLPDVDRQSWLENAEASIDFLKSNFCSDELILYASGPHVLIHGVLVPTIAVSPPDHNDLKNAFIPADDSWCIQRSFGGDEGHRVYLEPPLSSYGCNSMRGGEKLIFTRAFHGVDSVEPQIEISQKLVHALGLYFVPERHAYCRLDQNGDIESIIRIHKSETDDPWQGIQVVTILSKDIATYMALTEYSLVSKFDFTRFSPGNFSGWNSAKEKTFKADDLYYHSRAITKHASYANGWMILRTQLTEAMLVDEWKAEKDESTNEYASFKIFDRKNKRQVETSCSPNHIVNYFTDSDLPWEISPAFFKPEVLTKYKSDKEKYTFGDRNITCRNSWHLKTYDINEEGQVHTYIGYLANLPYEEQLYWKSFNEWPKAYISKRAFENDILGEYSSEVDPLHDLKVIVAELDKLAPKWWNHRGQEMLDAVHYPATDSTNEWGNELLSLDQLLVEGFLAKPLRKIATENKAEFDKSWGSLKILEITLISVGRTKEQANEIVFPLRELHSLRNPAKAHGDVKGRADAVKNARAQYGKLRAHFTQLAEKLSESISEIKKALPK